MKYLKNIVRKADLTDDNPNKLLKDIKFSGIHSVFSFN